MSRDKQEYLKFKPFADDLRKAESWCELDGVLNRYQTVKNLSKMGYRKSSEVAEEIFGEIEFEIHQLDFDREETRAIAIEGIIAILKKKYTESEKTSKHDQFGKYSPLSWNNTEDKNDV